MSLATDHAQAVADAAALRTETDMLRQLLTASNALLADAASSCSQCAALRAALDAALEELHQREQHALTCPRCSKSFHESDMEAHPDEFWTCPYCHVRQHAICREPIEPDCEYQQKLADLDAARAENAKLRNILDDGKGQSALSILWQENAKLREALERAGWGLCDIPACNCGGWHQMRPSRMESELQSRCERGELELDNLRDALKTLSRSVNLSQFLSPDSDMTCGDVIEQALSSATPSAEPVVPASQLQDERNQHAKEYEALDEERSLEITQLKAEAEALATALQLIHGSINDDVLCAKVPELVEALATQLGALRAGPSTP